jgi:hypothetical protein
MLKIVWNEFPSNMQKRHARFKALLVSGWLFHEKEEDGSLGYN